jgi:hypothetical protein
MEQQVSVSPHASGVIPAGVNNSAAKSERLPFTIRRVHDSDDLGKAVKVRHAAYARHVPEFARTLALPEACDFADDTVVLLAESRLDGSPVGSVRIQTNFSRPLHIEESIRLPDWLQGRRLAEVTRLGVEEGRIGRMVKIALIKAMFEYLEQNGIEFSIATGRAPIDRQYEQLLFTDVFEDKAMVPLAHVGGIPHRVMVFDIATGEERWRAANHPLLAFFRHTHHPDIDIGEAPAPRAKSVALPARTPAPRVDLELAMA